MIKQAMNQASLDITKLLKRARKGYRNEHTHKAVLRAYTDLAEHLMK